MVGGATNQPPQGSAPVQSSSSAAAALTEEEEFLKRNTDCVYFLASPLTCKKGSECEYRHSDIARVNPRDCWYWLNGNCLNPKCGFRHPPLDGLLEAELPPPVGPAATQAPAKQGVACIFFQKGFCLKGHLCPFWHGLPSMVNNMPVQPVPPNTVSKPAKVASVAPEKPIQEQKLTQQENVQKPTEFRPQVKQVPRVQPRNVVGDGFVEKKVAPPPEEPPRYIPAKVVPPPLVNELPPSRSNHGVYESNYVSDNEGTNGKDVDEYSREPTPGFDVLVDNEVGDSEYYPSEEQFGMGRSVDYDVDRDMYHDQRDFDQYSKEYGWVDNRDVSDFGRKRYPRDESPDRYDQSDLRHRISKQRRGNNGGGLRSVISREYPRDNYADHRHDRHMDSGPLSSRLQGRIKIPGRSTSPRYEHRLRVEREREREIDMVRLQRSRSRSRYSPGRPPHMSSNNVRFRDNRIRGTGTGRSNDDYRAYRGGNDREFYGPKRLSESRTHQTETQQADGKLSFEGPKPLSEILKRKRGSVAPSVNNEDKESNEKETKETAASVNRVNAENEKSTEGQPALDHEVAGSIDEDALLDEELEGYDDQRDGEYEEYEQIEGEEYNLEEGEEYYLEEGDESGKKESEVYS